MSVLPALLHHVKFFQHLFTQTCFIQLTMKHNSRLLAVTTIVLLALASAGCKKNLDNAAYKGIEKTEALARTKPNIIFIVWE